jgi:Rap1a immunity proteins
MEHKTLIAALLLASATLLVTPRAEAQTAGQMARFCAPYRHALVLAPGSSDNPVVEAPGGNARSNFCWGAFATLQSLANMSQAGAIQLYISSAPKDRLCIPVTVGRLQLVKTYLQYMDRHHELANTDFAVALIAAMFETYPCAKS